MKNLRNGWLVLMLGAALILTTGACGGGATTAPTTTTTALNALLGNYCFTSWRGDANGPLATSMWGTVAANGAGALTPDGLYENQGGMLTGPETPDPAAYALTPDHVLTVTTSGNTYVGGLAADGTVAAVAETKVGSEPGILVLGRTGAGFTVASLSGDYHVCAFYLTNGATNVSLFDGTATFDGAGACTGFAAQGNADGQLIGDAYPNFGTYTMEDDGTMSWDVPIADLGPLTGGLYAGGEIAVLTGAEDGSNVQSVFVLIKKGAGLSDASLDGTYTTVALIAGGGSYGSYTGQTVADGAGSWDLTTGTLNVDGVTQPFGPAVNQAYEVTADGRLDINAGQFRGGVSASGRFAVYAGGAVANTQPALWLLVR